MDIETFRQHCLALPGVTEDTPFGPDVLAFRVGGKIFALCDLNHFSTVNLKCDPDRAVELREQHSGIVPGYHMNKKHWNTVDTTGSVAHTLLKELIEHSYHLVRQSLTQKEREKLGMSTGAAGRKRT